MSKKEVLGSINFGYCTRVMLPLEEAHKIQLILAKHAFGVGSAYRSSGPSPSYLDEYSVPGVDVLEMPKYDCRGLTPEQKGKWIDLVRDSDGGDVLTPQEFVAIRGDTNE